MKTLRHRSGAALAASVALFAALGCAQAQEKVIRIGISMRMVDPIGEIMGKFALDKIDALNAAGGINGAKLEATLMNDDCNAAKAVQVVSRLIYEKRAHVIIAPTCSTASLATNEISLKAGVPTVMNNSAMTALTQKGNPWLFRVAVSQRFYQSVYAKFIHEKFGDKVAYLWSNDPTSDDIARSIQREMRKVANVEPYFEAQVQQGETDYRSALLRIVAAKPDAMVFSGTRIEDNARILKQANEMGLPKATPRVGGTGVSNAPVPRTAGDDVVGAYFASAFNGFDDRENVKAFRENLKAKYGLYAPDHDFSQTSDGLDIIFMALKASKLALDDKSLGADRTEIRDNIAKIKDYRGLAPGPISFCAEPTPQCRDGNRTILFNYYTKGGEAYEVKSFDSVTYAPDFNL